MAILARLKQILTYVGLSSTPWHQWNLLVLGYARGHPFTTNDFASTYGRKYYPNISVKPKCLAGKAITMDPKDISHIMVFEEVFVEKVYDLNLVLFEPDYIIDCGAHIGMFTTLAASRFPLAKVIAFEPNPYNIQFFEKQLSSNSLNVELVQAAVSTEAGKGWFKKAASMGGHLQLEQNEDSYEVNIINLVEKIGNLNSKQLLLKIDIEGEETNLLPMLIPFLPQRCDMFFETHKGEEDFRFLCSHLSKVGFEVKVLRVRDVYYDCFAMRK